MMMERSELAPKVTATYQAVIDLLMEGVDVGSLTVSEITGRAGIGKGTAYDYFSSKEEMIAGALFYEIETSCRALYELLRQEETLYDKMNLILIKMDERVATIGCFVKVLHLMLDHSAVGCELRKKIQNKRPDQILLTDLIRKVVIEETKDIGKLSQPDLIYLVMTILSRMICYAMYQLDCQYSNGLNTAGIKESTMREMACRDVCRSVEAYREKGF
ncbi:MAG: TetR/AcrR family transcriptional regulator [Lachnospiraceae bacterium]|nr:TetR/AcrR family transcriptional regulator [Lachnospiraceae bacterium]